MISFITQVLTEEWLEAASWEKQPQWQQLAPRKQEPKD